MDLTSAGLDNRLVSLSKVDLSSPVKKDDNLCKPIPVETIDCQGSQLVQRCVIVQRDEKGYGLTVSGDNPVFVQSVKEDGAAARAGVQQGDRIIKVNGTLVTQSNHVEVVKLIKSGSYVALTLLGRPLAPNLWAPGMPLHQQSPPQPLHQPLMHQNPPYIGSPQFHQHPHHHPTGTNMSSGSHNKPSSPTERITGPQPVDHEKQQQLSNSKIQTIRMMLEQELAYLEKLRSDFAKNSNSDKIRSELAATQKRCKTLDAQLVTLTGVHHDCGVPPSPTSHRLGSESDKGDNQEVPPPLPPPRRFQLPHQMSLPNVTVPSTSPEVRHHHAQSMGGEPLPDSAPLVGLVGTPPCSSPSHLSGTQQIPSSHSLENVQQSNAPSVSVAPVVTTTSSTSPVTAIVATTNAWKVPGGPTHSRQRSSPDALLHQTESLRQQHVENLRNASQDLSRSHSEITAPRKLTSSDSFSEGDNPKRRRGTDGASRAASFGHYDSKTSSPRVTPPGTPPPPYGSSDAMEAADHPATETSQTGETPGTPPEGQLSPSLSGRTVQHPIISMEDDDFPSDGEMGPSEDHGPFNKLSKLCERPAYLAVFMHFLISNSDPSSLFFYLITELYKEGNAKEMKKWAYEIHSSFLVPGAPLKVNTVDETILHEIDLVLQRDLDKEDVLRNAFYKARKKAQEELNELLADFRTKRTLGLGGFFGPPDSQLEESIHDKTKELKIIESLLVPSLESLSEDIENANNRTSAVASSLATLLYKLFGVKSQQVITLVERCPTFVSKEKSRIKVFNRNKKSGPQPTCVRCGAALTVLHLLVDCPGLHAARAHCNLVGDLPTLLGDSSSESQLVQGHNFVPQHYFHVTYCNHCQLIIWGVGNQGYQCQNCEMNIHKACVKVVEETCIGSVHNKKEKKRKSGLMENIMGKTRSKPSSSISSSNLRKAQDDVDSDGVADSVTGDKNFPNSRVEKLKNRYETLSENEIKVSPPNPVQELPTHGSPITSEPSTNGDSSKRSAPIGRSESLRTRREQRPSFRKRSDPNIPQTKSDAEDTTGSSLHPSASSSSCSSSTRSLDSPSNSLETVLRQTTVEVPPSSVPSSAVVSVPVLTPALRCEDSNDSDFEAEADPPNWADSVDWEIRRNIKPKEKKRQEVINELFHTERTHVRNLKVLERVFYRPMVQGQILPADQIKLLFANLEDMLKIHGQFNELMKSRRKENVVKDIGDLMLEMFDGTSGESFRQAAASFCKNQSFALEALKSKQKKDQKVAQFLADAEANPLCRRLQLKDIIPTGMQRLTKYPLLLENLAKYTPTNTEEYTNLMRAIECTKENLNYVNQMVKEAENHQRLVELQKKLDRGPFDKVDHPIAQEFRSLDLTKYKMHHEGSLTWRINRQRVIDLHVLLLEHFIVLLQKQDEKYILKFHKEETKLTHSPIIKLGNLLTRNVATDKRAFFLVSTSTVGPQIYELVALSSSDRKTWFRHITEAADAYKAREGKSKRTEQPAVPLPEKGDSTEEDVERKDPLITQDSQEVQEPGDNSDQGENTDSGETSDAASTSSTVKPAVDIGTCDGEPGVDDASLAAGAAAFSSLGPAPASGLTPVSGGTSPATQSPAPGRRFQRVEILQIAEGPILIEPSEVVISQGAVLQTAEPVLTQLEKLRRKDAIIHQELKEKHQLIAEVLHIPKEEYEHVAEMALEGDGEKDVKELLLGALTEANKLTEVINGSLMVSEEDAVSANSEVPLDVGPPAPAELPAPSPTPSRKMNRVPSAPVHSLITISSSLNQCLNQLLTLIKEREEERARLRKELRASREQIHQLHETHRQVASPGSSLHQSRPSSFISVGSSGTSEPCDIGECCRQPSDDVADSLGSCLEQEQKVLSDSISCVVSSPTHLEDIQPEFVGDTSTEMFVDEPVEDTGGGIPSVCEPLETGVEVSADNGNVVDAEPPTDNVNNPVYGAMF